MKPIDYRNANYHDLLKYISGQREAVLRAWRTFGPCTTEELAERSNISILTLRPRTTELYQLGFVAVDESGEGSTSGAVYRACSTLQILVHFRRHQREALTTQGELAL